MIDWEEYYKKVEILCRVDLKTLRYTDFDDLFEYYIHKLYVLYNRWKNKHSENYTFEKLYNADKQFWKYNYLNSSRKRHEISYDAIIDNLDKKEQSYLLEDIENQYKDIDNKIFIQELINKSNLDDKQKKYIELYLRGYSLKEINKKMGYKSNQYWQKIIKKIRQNIG